MFTSRFVSFDSLWILFTFFEFSKLFIDIVYIFGVVNLWMLMSTKFIDVDDTKDKVTSYM